LNQGHKKLSAVSYQLLDPRRWSKRELLVKCHAPKSKKLIADSSISLTRIPQRNS
jgi:hypothetical protein